MPSHGIIIMWTFQSQRHYIVTLSYTKAAVTCDLDESQHLSVEDGSDMDDIDSDVSSMVSIGIIVGV